ncbi:MAG: polysaccharide deacetylase family protein [Bacteroidetes bacterium]|nr:polysaccharide deacetylase family protein [Bacteroidota bacterium]
MKKAQNFLSAVRQKINYTNNDIRSLLRMNKSFFDEARGARIVLYHGICIDDPLRFNNIFLPVNTFREHIRFYKEHFNIISLDDFYQQRFSDDRFNICISFDDGYANNYRYVLPLLEQLKVPATFFITSIREAGYDILWNDFIGILGKYGPEKIEFRNEVFVKRRANQYVSVKTGEELKEMIRAQGFGIKKEMMETLYPLVSFRKNQSEEDYWLQMTEQEIFYLSNSKWATIGCHGYYHNDLAAIDIHDVETEMIQSKKYLERITGKRINSVAFPYGSYSRAVIDSAKKIGFTQLLATDFLLEEDRIDPSMRERFTVNPFISVNNQMIANIKGSYASRY